MTTLRKTHELEALFKRLGLSEDEAHVLLTLYQHPASPAGRIAEHARFKRGHTYNLLSALSAQGFVQEVIERGVKRFAAIAPSQLTQRVEQQRTELNQLETDVRNAVGTIEALIPTLKTLPNVQIFRGFSGVKELYQFTLSTKDKVIRGCADFSTVFPRKRCPEINDWLWQYATRRAKKGIVYRGIVTRSPDSDLAHKRRIAQKRELKLLSKSSLSVELNIFDSYVAITSTAEETMGVLIESQPIAESAKQLFDALWERLPEYSVYSAKKPNSQKS